MMIENEVAANKSGTLQLTVRCTEKRKKDGVSVDETTENISFPSERSNYEVTTLQSAVNSILGYISDFLKICG
jgi:hypothetical protein